MDIPKETTLSPTLDPSGVLTKALRLAEIHGCFEHLRPAHPGCADCHLIVTQYGDKAEKLLDEAYFVIQGTLEGILEPLGGSPIRGPERLTIIREELEGEGVPEAIIEMALRFQKVLDERVRADADGGQP